MRSKSKSGWVDFNYLYGFGDENTEDSKLTKTMSAIYLIEKVNDMVGEDKLTRRQFVKNLCDSAGTRRLYDVGPGRYEFTHGPIKVVIIVTGT